MNYAEKELSEAMAYLARARAAEEALKEIFRAFERGEPVQITLTSARASATDLCPAKPGGKVLETLLERAHTRVSALEKQEVYWCREVAHVARQEELNLALRLDPNLSIAQVQKQERENEAQAQAARAAFAAQKAKEPSA